MKTTNQININGDPVNIIEAFKCNSLNTVKIIAAFNVLYGHTITHLSIETPEPITAFISFFQGVPLFFAISGFLIWKSVHLSPTPYVFFKKRFLRIYPELWVGVLIEIICLLIFYNVRIPIASLLLFTLTQGSFLQFWTPDSLRDYGCGTPNGSLWTICVIIQFYLIVWLLYKLLHGKKFRIFLAIEVMSILVAVFSPHLSVFLPELAYKLYTQTIFPYFWLFLFGIILSEYMETIIPYLKKCWPLFLIISFCLHIFSIDINSGYGIFRCSFLIMGVIGFAYACPKVNIKTDFSYGVYIYHMTVVNVFIQLKCTANVKYGFYSFLITLFLAVISTRTIGKICVRFKEKINA